MAIRIPFTDLERGILAKLSFVRFPPATASKRFIGDVSAGYVKALSPKGRQFLAYVAHRFRRQCKFTDAEWQWIEDWRKKVGVNCLSYSKNGMALTEGFESCALTTYPDSKGVLTIGWGHTGPDVHEGLTITQDEADTLLMGDVSRAVDAVNQFVTIPLNQDEFDALVDFVFNVGMRNFAESTLLSLLNSGHLQAAALEFDKWDHCGGKVLAGLLRRRDEERALFEES